VLEAGLLVGADGAHVGRQDREDDVVQPEHVKRPVERQSRRLGSQSLTAALADRDPELRTAQPPIDAHEAGRADGRTVGQVVDREARRLGRLGRALGDRLADPVLLGFAGVDARGEDPAPHLEVVDPAAVGVGEVGAQWSERDALPLQHVVGLAHRRRMP
jgi:hypothetical protein